MVYRRCHSSKKGFWTAAYSTLRQIMVSFSQRRKVTKQETEVPIMTYTQHYDSPLGGILLAADDVGLTGLWFDGQKYFARGLSNERIEQETGLFPSMLWRMPFPLTKSMYCWLVNWQPWSEFKICGFAVLNAFLRALITILVSRVSSTSQPTIQRLYLSLIHI